MQTDGSLAANERRQAISGRDLLTSGRVLSGSSLDDDVDKAAILDSSSNTTGTNRPHITYAGLRGLIEWSKRI